MAATSRRRSEQLKRDMDWSLKLSTIAIALILLATAVAVMSPVARSRARVFIQKNFFRYKYDSRKEWLRFIATLTSSESENVFTTAGRAVAQIIGSPGAIVWCKLEEDGDFVPAGAWQSDVPSGPAFDADDELIRFLDSRQWIVDLVEYKTNPKLYGGFSFEPEMLPNTGIWLIVPMLLGSKLIGFIALLEAPTVSKLNFEDHDLLKTVGKHVASHIHQAEVDRRLTEARQFGTFNRLSTFLMHDLNNLIAQQSLVVRNAEKHRDNPEFVDDAISTIAHSVARMRALMKQLTEESKTSAIQRVNLNDAVATAIDRSKSRRPTPESNVPADPIWVNADFEQLCNVIEHLIRNAQDASTENQTVRLALSETGGSVVLSVADSGCGMSTDFIRERLFRPFDSTKGSQRMGIGAYQSREYVKSLGGKLEVSSTPGVGTEFRVRLPVQH